MKFERNDSDPEKYLLHYYEGTDIRRLSEAELEEESRRIYASLPVERKSRPKRIAYYAAAAVLFIVGALYLNLNSAGDNGRQPKRLHIANVERTWDATPAVHQATLILADGKRISLSNGISGEIATQQGVTIRRGAPGIVVYSKSASGATITKNDYINEFNTLSTVKGQQYQVWLPDGTKVWLNAASSITYPASFANRKLRQVKLTGEAYFEVAEDKEHPFIVETEKQKVEVLGTHFNISSYADEEATKTTLLEGSVRVSSQRETRVLLPGQQAKLTDEKMFVNNADLSESIDWKKGDFIFNKEEFTSILKEISRWYNVEVIYPGDQKSLKLSGTISRSSNLSTVLRALEITSNVSLKLNGRTLYVTN